MRKNKILKIMLIIIMGIILFSISTNVYAVDDDNIFIDIPIDNNPGTTTPDPDPTPTPDPTPDTNNNYGTELPKAGLAENTMLGVGVTVLIVIAIVAYKKVNEYKNI